MASVKLFVDPQVITEALRARGTATQRFFYRLNWDEPMPIVTPKQQCFYCRDPDRMVLGVIVVTQQNGEVSNWSLCRSCYRAIHKEIKGIIHLRACGTCAREVPFMWSVERHQLGSSGPHEVCIQPLFATPATMNKTARDSGNASQPR